MDIKEEIEVKEEELDPLDRDNCFLQKDSQSLIGDVEDEGDRLEAKNSQRSSPQTPRKYSERLKKKELNKLCCTLCDHSSKNGEKQKNHLDPHKKKFKCVHCSFECKYKRNLRSHMLKHSNKKLFKCSDCNYQSSIKGSLKQHMLTHANFKLFKCSECNYECNHKGNLKAHMLTHANFKLFKCSECNYQCNQKGSLKAHLLTHNNFKLFKCSKCN